MGWYGWYGYPRRGAGSTAPRRRRSRRGGSPWPGRSATESDGVGPDVELSEHVAQPLAGEPAGPWSDHGASGSESQPGDEDGGRQGLSAPNAARQSASSRMRSETLTAWSWSAVSTTAACRARAGQVPPARSATAIRGSQVSAARSSSGMDGSAFSSSARCLPSHRSSWAATEVRAGRSRRCRNGATVSPGARRRILITTARSSMVSGIAPIPASAAMAKVGMVSRLRVPASHRMAGRLRWCPALSSPRS